MLLDIALGNDVLNMTPKAQITEAKEHKLHQTNKLLLSKRSNQTK
jgi:hypothetical protein